MQQQSGNHIIGQDKTQQKNKFRRGFKQKPGRNDIKFQYRIHYRTHSTGYQNTTVHTGYTTENIVQGIRTQQYRIHYRTHSTAYQNTTVQDTLQNT